MENSIGDVTSDNTGCQKIVRTVPQNGIVYHHLNQKFKAGENDLIVAANKDDVTYTAYNAEDMPTRPDVSMESKCSDEVGLEVSSNPVSAENCIQVLNIVETKSLSHVRIAPEVEPSNEVGCNLVCDGNHKASPLNEDCANSHLANDIAILPALHSLTLDESSAALADPTAVTEADIVDNIVTASCGVCYARYRNEEQMPAIIHLITKDLSEPYSIYTYRYFIHNWPSLCYLAIHESRYVGAIVCKLDFHKKITRRGYIAMLAVDETVRRKKIGSTLVKLAIETMADEGCDEVVLETEVTNHAALHLYEKLGFVRDKRLFRYYLNGVDALRLKLWLC